MQLTDLLFLVAALGTLVSAILLRRHLVRGERSGARRVAMRVAIAATAYFTLLLAASLTQPGRSVALNQDECFDDWCIAVTNAKREGTRLVVTLRISNHGRGRTQAEPDAYVYLHDEAGRDFLPQPFRDASGSIGDPIQAGASLQVRSTFVVPAGDSVLGLVKARRARFPGIFIIGDPTSLLHRPTIHALTS